MISLNDMLSLKTEVYVSEIRNEQQKKIYTGFFFVGILKATAKKSKIQIPNPVYEDPAP